jgi:hypothetical protein
MRLWRAEKPAREKKNMKKTALAIVFAAATLPLTFAAQTPATPAPAKDKPAATATKKPVKKHVKHVTKKSVSKSTTAPATVSK